MGKNARNFMSPVSNSGPNLHQEIKVHALLWVSKFTTFCLVVSDLILSCFQYLQTFGSNFWNPPFAVRLMKYWIHYELRLKIMQSPKKMLTKTEAYIS